MKNQKISKSLKLFYKTKKRNQKLRIIGASICITAGILTASYSIASYIRYNIAVANAESVDALTEQQAKEIYGIDNDMEAKASVPVSTTGGAVVSAPEPVVLEQEIEKQIKNTFPKNYKIAIAIAKCESQLDKKAIGDTTTKYQSTGLFQIRELPQRMKYYNLTTEKLQDPTINILMAHIIYNRSGWSPWTCFSKKLYKKYL